ncbi:HAD-IC family P-type ATPase [Pseudoflavonifractor sp. MSJ-37]|uniref:HAD-IC family P-type ATPase n=1 Tax=Pseudoflavonifractor sp. MSJ-37 TaxID=2841531 RepID=UPI001C0F6D06|nr:HAD-IC family P-type ATPase [Pseudoflavonifractor sp. MSJ-37]MBU5434239.1 HAD-IC family P-type ATPase [Pseudoflavonifractor sp. MSJ-37]
MAWDRIRERRPVERLEPDPARGLTAQQAEERRAAGWDNTDPAGDLSKSVGQIVRDDLFTFFNLLFLAMAACLFLVGAFRDMLFLGIVACNTAVSIVQELRVKRTLDRIALLSAPTAAVIRDGRTSLVPTGALVLDDIVALSAGDQICADAVVTTGSIEVNEALLTGEADLILKRPGDRLLSGSFVAAGRCTARLDRVGPDSWAAGIGRAAKGRRRSRSQMIRSLDRLLRIIGVAVLPLGTVLFYRQYVLLHAGLRYTVSSTVAAMVGMIPEGLYLLVSVALAVGAAKLARRQVLAHELSCIEALARVDTLCLDKTGTLTEGCMEVLELRPLGLDRETLEGLVSAFVHTASSANATAQALKARFPAEAPLWRPEREVFFSSERKWSALVFSDGMAYLLGAPERLLGPDWRSAAPDLEEAVNDGQRVLLLARGRDVLDGDRLTGRPEPLGFLFLSDQLRRDAPQTLAYFREQGVDVKIISGDNAAAVAQTARRAGIAGAERWLDLSTLPEGTDLAPLAEAYTVFGRVTPQQKQALLHALQSRGHKVAMMGDGVNDVLALKDADCSIAMAAGSDAAQQVSHLVLLESDFSVLPQVVREGRRVVNNIERSASLFLVKNLFSFLTAVVMLFLPLLYPLVPAQVSLVSGLLIGAPSFLLTFEPTYVRIRGHFLRNVLWKALPGGLTDLAAIFGTVWLGGRMGLPQAQISTVCALLLAFNGLLVLVWICRPMTPYRAAVLAGVATALCAAVRFLSPWFQLVTLTASGWRLFLRLVPLGLVLFSGLAWAAGRAGASHPDR